MRISATGTDQTIRLFETSALRVEDQQIVFRAQVRAEGGGEYYTKVLVFHTLSRTYFGRSRTQHFEPQPQWRTVEANHLPIGGAVPERLELDLVIK